MQLTVYDLVGALFAPSDPSPVSRHTDKLFARTRDVIFRVKFEMEITMRQSDKTFVSSQLEYDAWRDLFRSKSGRYYSEGIKPSAFTGWVRPVSVRGFTALDIGCNAQRVERTYRDVRLDGADHYFAVFQVDGQLAMTHNDQVVRLAAGDVALVDAALPVTYSADSQDAPWNTVSLNLPREPACHRTSETFNVPAVGGGTREITVIGCP
jgi:hypothetical protein